MDDHWARNLQRAKLGDTEFPLARMSRQGGRRLARHRYPYRDGQDTEDMGRAPLSWDLVVPLFRGMEGFDPNTPLYPNTYEALRLVLDDPFDRGETEFVDPELGPVDVKVITHVWDMTSDKRNGGVYRIQLEERSDDPFVFVVGTLNDSELDALQSSETVDQDLPFDFSVVLGIWAAAGFAANFPHSGTDLFVSMTDDFHDTLDSGSLTAEEIGGHVDIARSRVSVVLARDEVQQPEAWSVYQSLVRLADQLTQAGTRRLSDAPRFVEFVTPWQMSHWEIALLLYADRYRGPEIAAKNPTRNPLFYPAGITLRVLDR